MPTRPVKLFTIGDSLTQGFQSGSISRTDWSYPAILARALGAEPFRIPDFAGEGGLPVNLEQLIRLLAKRYGKGINLLELPAALITVQRFLDRVEDHWERDDGNDASGTGPLHHNVAVWGFEVGDADTLSEGLCRRVIPPPKDNLLGQLPEFPMYRTARRTLNPGYQEKYEAFTQVDIAAEIAATHGIENLIFALGANNALGTALSLEIKWSDEGDLQRFAHERSATLWTPRHFEQLYRRLADKLAAALKNNKSKNGRVFVGNVPRVTIPPVSRGITPGAQPGEGRDGDGYYEYYTHFWIWDGDFAKDPHDYPHLTREQARKIDETIEAYNDTIRTVAKEMGWTLVDLATVLDNLAFRRSAGKPRYEFPPALVKALKANPATKNRFTPAGRPILDTRFLRSRPRHKDKQRRFQGGIFSLDGVHPTTIGYGLVAHEYLKAMDVGNPETLLPWDDIVAADPLVTDLPENLENLRDLLAFLSKKGPLQSLLQLLSDLR